MIVEIAGHKIKITTKAKLIEIYEEEDKFPERYLRLEVLQFYAYWDTFDDPRTWLEIGGHDPSKIDFAVPQPWFERYYDLHKEKPRACWTYEKDQWEGQPLFLEQVREDARVQIAVKLKRMINTSFGGEVM